MAERTTTRNSIGIEMTTESKRPWTLEGVDTDRLYVMFAVLDEVLFLESTPRAE